MTCSQCICTVSPQQKLATGGVRLTMCLVSVLFDVTVLQRALHIPRNTVHMLTLTSVNVGHPGCIPQANIVCNAGAFTTSRSPRLCCWACQPNPRHACLWTPSSHTSAQARCCECQLTVPMHKGQLPSALHIRCNTCGAGHRGARVACASNNGHVSQVCPVTDEANECL